MTVVKEQVSSAKVLFALGKFLYDEEQALNDKGDKEENFTTAGTYYARAHQCMRIRNKMSMLIEGLEIDDYELGDTYQGA